MNYKNIICSRQLRFKVFIPMTLTLYLADTSQNIDLYNYR